MTARARVRGAGRVKPGRHGRGRDTDPRVEVPEAVRKLVQDLEGAGFESWTVGGGVRDAVRGSPGNAEDWDLATRATPPQVRRLFRRTVALGEQYGTVGVFGEDGNLYEVTTFRHDVITYGRKARVAFAETLDEDLARRDFTVNAMAWHPLRRELRDPHGGRSDLARGILRTVGHARERFREDYLRVLRGLRFAGALGLDIEEDTWEALEEAVPRLALLSPERVREELVKVLAGSRPSGALVLYRRSGALKRILPELTKGVPREALATVDALGGLQSELLRMAVLLLFGHGRGPGRAEVATLLAGLRFSNAEAARIGAVVKGGLAPPPGLAGDPVARRGWVAATAKAGPTAVADVIRVWRTVARALPVRGNAGEVERVVAGIRGDLDAGVPTSVAQLAIAGRDLVARGWLPGPGIGAVLRALLEAVWRDPTLNDRARLLDMAAAMNPARKAPGDGPAR